MAVQCFVLDLKDDPALIAEYCKWHEPGGPPPAVNRAIRDAGITEMQIYRVSNRLFMVMHTNETYDAARRARADAANPEVQAWEERMWAFQQALPWARPGEKWIEAKKIYALTEQP